MAKQPVEIRDSFNFTVMGVAAEQLGELVAVVTKMGFTQTRHELVTDVISFKSNQRHEVKAEDFLMPWLDNNPTFRARDAVKYFEDNGRTAASAYTALKVLVEKNVLTKLEAGNYQRADIKAIAAPKKLGREHHEIDHREFILRYGRQHPGRMSVAKLRAHFDTHGRKPSSVGGALNWLAGHKMIKSLGDGEYMLTAKGSAKPPGPKEAPPPKLNGNGAHLVEQQQLLEGVIHG